MSLHETSLFLLLAGAALLLAGRRLFWLFVGLVGFFTVYHWFEPYGGAASSARLLLAVLAGIAGIVLAIFVQKVAVALAGFFAGGWFAAQLLGLHMAQPRGMDLLIFAAAGIVTAILAVKLFDVALVLLTSLAGAGLILDSLHLAQHLHRLLFLVLFVVGLAVQFGFTARQRRRRE
ncbi:MAG TPA: hypothetical protein VF173_19335 [Thermoanaerobaculia bacterium]|nr:hypothetical protein [Thermoanaerobaculia bacterium]